MTINPNFIDRFHVFYKVFGATGASVGPLVQVAQQATGMGMSLSPASSPMLLVCSTLGINIMTAIKRSALPILCGLAVLVMHGLIVC